MLSVNKHPSRTQTLTDFILYFPLHLLLLWLSPFCRPTKLLQLCRLCATQWTVARQALLSTGLSRQEYWSELLCPPPEDLPEARITPLSFVSLTSLPLVPPGSPFLYSLTQHLWFSDVFAISGSVFLTPFSQTCGFLLGSLARSFLEFTCIQ